MNDKNVTIKDIARLAGVSVGTVDRVLHNRGRVSPKTLEKIMAVLKKNGYRFREYDVISDESKFDEMVEMTGQSFAPCMRLRMDGSVDKILSDFGVEELVDLIEEIGLMPDNE